MSRNRSTCPRPTEPDAGAGRWLGVMFVSAIALVLVPPIGVAAWMALMVALLSKTLPAETRVALRSAVRDRDIEHPRLWGSFLVLAALFALALPTVAVLAVAEGLAEPAYWLAGWLVLAVFLFALLLWLSGLRRRRGQGAGTPRPAR